MRWDELNAENKNTAQTLGTYNTALKISSNSKSR